MYNFSGIYADFIVFGGAGLIGCVIMLVESRFWNKEKRNIKKIMCAIVCVIFTIYVGTDFGPAIKNPIVSVCESNFSEMNGGREYIFKDDSGTYSEFILPRQVDQDILTEPFEEGVKYRVYYEERTDIIVKVERIE